MPLYEYKCGSCGEVFEVIQKFSDAPLETHEKCGGSLERLISAAGLHFKGTGWYVTDYGRGGKNGSDKSDTKTGKSDDKTKTESSQGESGKSENKSETKSDTKTTSSPKPSSESKS